MKLGGGVGFTAPKKGYLDTRRGAKLPDSPLSIRVLEVDRSKEVRDDDVRRIGHLPELETLIMQSTSVTDAGIAHLVAAPKLVGLYIGGLPLTDKGILPLKKLPLRVLHIGTTKLTDESIPLFAGFDELESLNLFGVPITDKGLEGLAKMKSLRKLFITQTKVTEAGVKKLAAALPECMIEWNGGTIEPAKKP